MGCWPAFSNSECDTEAAQEAVSVAYGKVFRRGFVGSKIDVSSVVIGTSHSSGHA